MASSIPIYDFTVDDASSIPFEVIPLEEKKSYDPSLHHRHNYYEIFLFVKGGGEHHIDFKTFDIQSGSVHFLSPGQVHLVQRALGSYGYVIFFSRDFYSLNLQNKDILFELPFLNNNTANPILNLDAVSSEIIKGLFESLMKEFSSKGAANEGIIRSYLNIVMLKCKELYLAQNQNVISNSHPVNKLVHQYKVLVEKNFGKLHLVKDYAEMLATSPEYLTEATKKLLGKPASELISDRIVLEAKRLLLYSDLSNKEIAHVLNYDDPSYFSRFLKNKLGMSPSEFRTRMGEK